MSAGRPSPWERVAPAALLALLVLAVHAPSPGGLLTAHHDNLDGAAPLRMEAVHQWRAGQVPLWNPWKRAGMPLLADTTAGAAYPGNLPLLLTPPPDKALPPDAAAAARAPFLAAMDAVAALHAVLAALGTMLLLRSLGVGTGGQLLGGLAFGAGGTMQWFAAWYLQLQNAAAWTPLILACVLEAGRPGARRARWVLGGGGAVAMQLLAGYPEAGFYTGLLAGLLALWCVGDRGAASSLAGLFGVYVAGAALAGFQLLPSVELALASRRPGALSLEMFQSLPASTAMLRWWVQPPGAAGFDFPPLAAYHVGAAVVLAALVGAVQCSRASGFAIAMLVVGFLLAVGPATPVSGWAWHLPLLHAFRHPFKHLLEVALGLALLAGMGTDRLLGRSGASPRVARAALLAALLATAWSLRAGHESLVAGNPAGVDVSGQRPSVADSIEPGWRVLAPRHWFQPRDPAFLLGDYPSMARVAAVHGAGPYLWKPLADATGMIEEETQWKSGLPGGDDRTLDLLATRYAVQWKKGAAFQPTFDAATTRVVREAPGMRLLERSRALPRLRFVERATCADAAANRRSLEQNLPDPATDALLACPNGGSAPVRLAPPSASRVELLEEEPGRLLLGTQFPGGEPALLVVSQADFPGWKATSDHGDLAVQRVQGLVQGLLLPPGTTRVELRYQPRSFTLGVALSAASLLLLLGAALRR